MSELRWHPLLGEWVITATHRQNRTFFPPADYCPLCATKKGGFPTEIPAPDYDIVVFENKFPSLQTPAPEPAIEGTEFEPVGLAEGACEVVCFSPEHNSSLAEQPVKRILNLIRVWTDRFQDLDSRPNVKSIFIFENKGREIGVTLAHPHGQIYAYPFIPPRIATEVDQARKHFAKTGGNLLLDIAASEIKDGRRIVAETESFVVFIPFFARYPYELFIIAKERGKTALTDFTAAEQLDLAIVLKKVLVAFDNLFGFSLPYILAMHQRPSDGEDYTPLYQFHIEFYPPLRTKDKLKYLAGSEAGAGAYINDTLAEEKALELRKLYEAVEL
jgi:UDPglucose--hexose-1-phosphate uridylyltransferase